MLDYTEYTKILLGLIAIVNPLGAVPIFVALTNGAQEKERKAIARTVVITVTLVLLGSLMIGEMLLNFFGITVNSFRIGSGALIFLMAVSMMQARLSRVVHTQEEVREGESKESVAVVPLSMPLLAGPGAISTVILYSNKGEGAGHYLFIGLDILLLSFMLWIVLQSVPWITRHVSQTGINIFTRIMGLILAAIAVEFIAAGIKGIFPGLAS